MNVMFWCCDLSWEWYSMCKCRVAQHTEKKSNRVAFFLTWKFRPNCMNAYLLKFPVKKKDSARISRKKKARKFIRFLLNPHMFLVHTLYVCVQVPAPHRTLRKGKNTGKGEKSSFIAFVHEQAKEWRKKSEEMAL